MNTKSEDNAFTADDYAEAALLLSRTYPAMKSERENIRRWQDGERKYTKDDALAELISITSKSDDSLGVRVQTSGTSDPTAKLGELLASGYVEKRQREIMRELSTPEMLDHIAYLDWKTGIVETAMAERMTKLQRSIYQLLFFKGYTYSELIKGNRGKRQLNDRKINLEKRKALEAVADEVESAFQFEQEESTSHTQKLLSELEQHA